MNEPAILVVTGASGAGKTTAVRALTDRGNPDVRCFSSDMFGVPSLEVMQRDFGGPEAWQAHNTKSWIMRFASENAGAVYVLDTQVRPSVVRDAAAAAGLHNVRVVLFDCNPATRQGRLAKRGQPELATGQMDNWAAYLRGQADALGLPVIDTNDLTISAMADALELEIEALRAEADKVARHR